MMHWKARRILPSLLDDTLDEETTLDLRVHIASCARCRRAEREFDLSESMLRRLPISLLPVEYNPTSYGRLVSLSRWYDDPALATTPERWRAPCLTAASLAVVLMMAVAVGSWAPIVGASSGSVVMLSGGPTTEYLPMTWSGSAHGGRP